MRLLHTFRDPKDAQTLSSFLSAKEIENQVDITTNKDWGSDEYGDVSCRLWIINEEDLTAAHEWLKRYDTNPQDPMFLLPPTPKVKEPPRKPRLISIRPAAKPKGVLSLYIIIGCTLLFFLSEITTQIPRSLPQNLSAPLFSSPIKKAMYYDLPEVYTLLETFLLNYGQDALNTPQQLPPEGQLLRQQLEGTHLWHGFYEKAIGFLKRPRVPLSFPEPMFEKIQKGQIWRLLTPCFLHSDLLHLLFNMIWLLILGRQMEDRIGIFRFLLFILLTGTFSNTAQYLMGGSNFIGFSGVVCAIIAFIWYRQQEAPWEGYQLLPVTMAFISIFVLAMAGIQTLSFLLEVTGQQTFSTGLANTAHLAGAAAGYLLAQLNFFSWQSKT